MQRKEAEKLLAALIFDDLDEASKTELLTYLQSDDELRERLADMRMVVKVTSDTVRHGPEPVLGKRRLKRLARLARHHRSRPTIFTVPRLAAAAAIFIIAAVGPTLVLINMRASSERYPALHRGRQTEYYDGRGIVEASKLSRYETPQTSLTNLRIRRARNLPKLLWGEGRVNTPMTQWLKVRWIRPVGQWLEGGFRTERRL